VGRAIAVRGKPIRSAAYLTLAPRGDGYVWGVAPGTNTGTVGFDGTYLTQSGTPSVEARLVRVDNGQAVSGFDWQTLPGQTVSGGTWSGAFTGVPASIGFYRQVRYAGQTATQVLDGQRNAVGLVMLFNAQSQTAALFSNLANDSGRGAIAPAPSANSWSTYLGLLGSRVIDNVNNSPTGSQTVVRRIEAPTVGSYGDGCIVFGERLRALTGMPVMMCNGANGGQSPQAFYADRKTAVQALTIGSATTAQTFTPNPDTVGGFVNRGVPPIIRAGTLVITVGGGTITDNGSGVLSGSGSGWTATGTVDYKAGTNAISLTFTGSGFSGAASASWTFISDYLAATMAAKATLNGFSQWGVIGQPNSGIIAGIYSRLTGNTVTAVVLPWWTSYLQLALYGGPADYTPRYNDMKIELDAIMAAHKSVAPSANARFFFAPAARETPSTGTTEDVNRAKYGMHRAFARAYVAANTNTRLLAEAYDATIFGNAGPHEDAPGYQMLAERYAVSVAEGLGIATTAQGPKVTSIAFTDGTKTAIDVTFNLGSATALATVTDGAFTGSAINGIAGFEVGTDASSQTTAFGARAATGFTASIVAANRVRLTKTSGAWSAFTSVSYAAGGPIFTGTANGAADLVTLNKLLLDNVNGGKFTFPTTRVWPGAPVTPILDQLAA
jgi:hypothetical protein